MAGRNTSEITASTTASPLSDVAVEVGLNLPGHASDVSSADGAAPASPRRQRRGLTAAFVSSVPRLSVQLGAVAFLIGVWWLIAELAIWPPLLVPSPVDVWNQFTTITTVHDGLRGYSGYLLQEHLWISLSRLLTGAGLAIILGVPTGLLFATVKPIAWAFGPLINFLRNLPPLAYFSLLIIWFGIDDQPKVILLFLSAFPAIVIATMGAVGSVPVDRVNAARMLGANRFQVIRHVTFPSIAPEVMTGIRVAVGIAFTTIVAAETINGIPGIGGMISDAQRYNATDVVILGIIVIGLCGLALDMCIRGVDRVLVPWRGR